MQSYEEYRSVKQEDFGDVEIVPVQSHRSVSLERKYIFSLVTLLLASNLINWFLTRQFYSRYSPSCFESPSPYAGLVADNKQPIVDPNSPYASATNDTATIALWQSINLDSGTIALPDTLANSFNLPHAERFPWDHSKGMFFLTGYHNLHCTKTIAISLYELKHSLPLSWPWHHVLHCVDVLRRDVLCHADDTPRAADEEGTGNGFGQTKQCRSWDKLEKWAERYNACFRNINETAPRSVVPMIERFKYCPKGSPYRDRIARIWGPDFLERIDRGSDV